MTNHRAYVYDPFSKKTTPLKNSRWILEYSDKVTLITLTIKPDKTEFIAQLNDGRIYHTTFADSTIATRFIMRRKYAYANKRVVNEINGTSLEIKGLEY